MRTLVFLCLAGCLNVVPEGGDGGTAGGASAGGGSAVGGGSAGSGGSGGSAGATGGSGGATGGGLATGGGSGGGLADGGTCGCTQMGRCVPGDSPLACGNTGGVCSLCGMGEQCVGGRCMTAACGPGTCNGCCGFGFCVTSSMQSGLACGANGAMCSQCSGGQQCRNGACVAPVCDMMSCAMGCCQNGQCLPGSMRRACGTGGNTCADCGMNGQCNGGTCSTGGPDAGPPPPPAPIGSACAGGAANGGGCGAGEFCLPDMAGFPGGYCSAQCSAGATCPGSSVCVTQSLFGVSQSGCFATCGAAPGGCRTGYVCQGRDAGSSYCRPHCTGGIAAMCPMGSTCNVDAGTCD